MIFLSEWNRFRKSSPSALSIFSNICHVCLVCLLSARHKSQPAAVAATHSHFSSGISKQYEAAFLYHSFFLCIDHCTGSVQFEKLLLLPHSPKIRISEPLTATIASRRKIGDQMEKRPPFFAIEGKVHYNAPSALEQKVITELAL